LGFYPMRVENRKRVDGSTLIGVEVRDGARVGPHRSPILPPGEAQGSASGDPMQGGGP
jgi:hypothetical protein